MSEPPPSHRPLNGLRLFGGIMLGLVLFFVVGMFSVVLMISAMPSENLGMAVAVLVTLGALGSLYALIRKTDRSIALGLLIGAGCALLLFGTCIVLLMNTSFH